MNNVCPALPARQCAALSVPCSKAKTQNQISYQSFAQIRMELLIHSPVHVELYYSFAGDIDFHSEFLQIFWPLYGGILIIIIVGKATSELLGSQNRLSFPCFNFQ